MISKTPKGRKKSADKKNSISPLKKPNAKAPVIRATTKKREDAAEPPPVHIVGRRGPLKQPQAFEPLTIKSHRELFAKSREITRRVRDDPDFSVMLLSNPILALKAYGIKLSKELQHHILTTLRHPPKLRARREELEIKLGQALGETPKPTDPAWMARLVFETQKRTPLNTGKLEPAYVAPLNEKSIKRLQARRPKSTKRYSNETRLPVRFSLGVATPKNAIRRLDLDAELPALKPAANMPDELELEQAWFYKDDPIVRDAVELGYIMRRGFPFKTPAEFRQIEAGTTVDAFRRFVQSIRLKEVTPK